MAIIALVTAWALVEAILAVALAAHPAGGSDRPNIFAGLLDWRL